MPSYKRKRSSSRRSYGKKRFTRRYGRLRSRINKSRIFKKYEVHNFRRTIAYWTVLSNGSADQHHAWNFHLSDISNYNEYTAMYDQYKIKKIILRFEPSFTSNDATNPISANTIAMRYYRLVRDYDDTNTLANEDAYLEYQNVKSYPCNRMFKAILYPKILASAYQSAVSTGYAMKSPMWFDCQDYGIPHYGIKMFVPFVGLPNNALQMKVIATYILQFKNTR